MIIDSETNHVFFSYIFPEKFKEIYESLVWHFDRHNIKYGLLPDTHDIWAVDYMPIQVDQAPFIQFKYDPSYLKTVQHRTSKTDQFEVCRSIGLKARCSNIILDGGNIVKSNDKVIVTNRVFKENGIRGDDDILMYLHEELQVGQVILIPEEPYDTFGHSDGILRFIDANHVVINSYPKHVKEYRDFDLNLRACLRNAKLKFEELPYTAWKNKGIDATGCYMNFLEVGDFIFLPVFGISEDMMAFNIIEQLFPYKKIIDIDCSKLALSGGVLNCVSWNIKTQNSIAFDSNRIEQYA